MPPTKTKKPREDSPEPSTFSEDQLVMVAQMYYTSELSQAEIAKKLGVSQPRVSRMLELTRKRGIVRISIVEYDPFDHEAEAELKSRLGLSTVVVIHTGNVAQEQERQTVAHFSAPAVARLIDKAKVVAVAGGRALCALADNLQPSPKHGAHTVVQAMGCVGAVPQAYDSIEIGRRIAKLWGAQFLMLNTPAFFPTAEIRNTMVAVDQIRNVLDQLRRANLALVGVGTLQDSIFLARKAVDQTTLSELVKAGGVGETCGHFYKTSGQDCIHPHRERVVGIELDWLRSIPNVVGVVTGEDRAEAVLSGIRGGIYKSLVTNSALARRLLKLAE